MWAIQEPGESDFLPGERVDQRVFADVNKRTWSMEGRKPAEGRPELMGITKASLATDSWLSAASFQETTRGAHRGRHRGRSRRPRGPQGEHHHRQADPAGTGMQRYQDIQPSRPSTSRWSSTAPTTGSRAPSTWRRSLRAARPAEVIVSTSSEETVG